MSNIIFYDNVDNIINNIDFIENYNKYYKNNEQNQNIKLFLEKIKKNKNYYKLNIDTLNKISNKTVNIESIKNIKNNLNKLTGTNKNNIFTEILKTLEEEDISTILIDILIDSIIINNTFIDLYIELIKIIIIKYNINLNLKIEKFNELLYKNHNISNENDYNLLCEKNKCTDNSIGYTILVTKLEMNNLIENKLYKLISELLNKFDINNEEDLYKYILCIYNIIKIKDIKDTDVFIQLKNKLEELNKILKNKKIKFKIMDIFDILE
mgnify:CR=1 FL=1